MAKNFNSVNFAALLLVLLMASTGILKSEAVDCIPGGCIPSKVFAEECGAVPFTGDCCKCCKEKYPLTITCWAAVEGSDQHCHCYKHGI